MSKQSLACSSIVEYDGWLFIPDYSDLNSDVDDPDVLYITPWASQYNPLVRCGFDPPSYNPTTGTNLQKFRVEFKRWGEIFSTPLPTITIELREIGVSGVLASESFDVPNDYDSHVIDFTWDASLLTLASGANVVCGVVCYYADDGVHSANSEIGGVEWEADYPGNFYADIDLSVPAPSLSADATSAPPVPQFNADIAFTVPRPSISAGASYTQAQYGADIAISVPAPSLFAAAEFMPESGTTGWFGPTGVVQIGTNVTVSNASNITVEDVSFASANLQRSGGTTLQETNRLAWDWVDPANHPEGAEIVGVEFALYIQYDTENHSNHFIYPYHLVLAGGFEALESFNETNQRVGLDQEDSPLWSNARVWGGKTELFGLDPHELVTDFFTWIQGKFQDKNASLVILDSYGSGDLTATIKLAYVKAKLWWELPNYKDMAATPSFSVGIDDSAAPLQKISDIAASLSASMTASVPRVTANPYTLYSDTQFTMIIEPPTISEGLFEVDMACWIDISLDLVANAIRIRDMYADSLLEFSATAAIGYSNRLYADYTISVVMDPQLHRDVELQTDALTEWFGVTMDVDGLVGYMTLDTDMPISVTMNPDNMVVNWALYAAAEFSVTAQPVIAKMTNLYCDMAFGVTVEPRLEALINIYSDFVMDGLLFNSVFVTLPVPSPEERVMYMEAKDRFMRMKPKGRKITLTQN